MSHELRTPLNAIIGFSEIIMNPRARRWRAGKIRRLRRRHKRLGPAPSVLDQRNPGPVEDRGRPQRNPGKRDRPRYPGGIRRGTCSPRSSRKAIWRWSSTCRYSAPALLVDGGKLKQCLANLLSNASKSSRAGGRDTVTITARFPRPAWRAWRSCGARHPGIGIAKEDIAIVLSPFGQVESAFHRSHTGTGLGLPIAKALIEQAMAARCA